MSCGSLARAAKASPWLRLSLPPTTPSVFLQKADFCSSLKFSPGAASSVQPRWPFPRPHPSGRSRLCPAPGHGHPFVSCLPQPAQEAGTVTSPFRRRGNRRSEGKALLLVHVAFLPTPFEGMRMPGRKTLPGFTLRALGSHRRWQAALPPSCGCNVPPPTPNVFKSEASEQICARKSCVMGQKQNLSSARRGGSGAEPVGPGGRPGGRLAGQAWTLLPKAGGA